MVELAMRTCHVPPKRIANSTRSPVLEPSVRPANPTLLFVSMAEMRSFEMPEPAADIFANGSASCRTGLLPVIFSQSYKTSSRHYREVGAAMRRSE